MEPSPDLEPYAIPAYFDFRQVSKILNSRLLGDVCLWPPQRLIMPKSETSISNE